MTEIKDSVHMGELSKLKGLDPKSEISLNEIGIHTKQQLQEDGCSKARIKLKQEGNTKKPSLNFLYAMVGALEKKHWVNIAKSERGRLLIELDGFLELKEILRDEGIEI